MEKLFFIYGILFLVSCGHMSFNTNGEVSNKKDGVIHITKTDTIQSLLSKDIEKVIIEYWDNYYANNFIFEIISNKNTTQIFYWGETLFTDKRSITELSLRNQLVDYINLFYIDKTENIILGINENEPIITESPFLSVMIFQEGKQVSKENRKIEHHIAYHACFIEFYKLLDSIVKKDR